MKKLLLVNLLLFSIFCIQNVSAQATFLNEDFTTCSGTLPAGWTKYSVVGSDSWSCTNFAYSGSGVVMSGYSGGNNNTNEDWLISPALNLSAYTSPALSFWCRTKYAGPFIQVMVSNNYAGSGNPNTATWTTLPVTLPTTNSDTWFLAGPASLLTYKNQTMHLAFKYTSTTADAATWRIDNVNVTDGTLSLSRKFLNVGECGAGSTSPSSSFSFTMSAIQGNFEVNVPSPFQISKDGNAFYNYLSYTSSIAGIPQTVYVRVAPNTANKVFREEVTFLANSTPLPEKVKLLGTSMPDGKTLRVFNWNMRWFGDPTMCACDTQLAKSNAIQILKDLNADLYCLQEVVSINLLQQVKNALGPNYDFVVSTFCSGVTSTTSTFYPTCQKLAYIYNTQKIDNSGVFGLLSSTYPSDTSAYYCFSSGRFPFIMKAKLKLSNAQFDTLIVANIHGKAGATTSDYNRRKCAAESMTDSLNALFGSKKILIAGDFNDYLEGTPVSGQSVSPYQYVLNNGFTGITLPSKYPNQSTFVTSSNHIIDNVVTNSSLLARYPDSTCFIFTEPDYYINQYSAATSDHFGVMSYYQFDFPNSVKEVGTKTPVDFYITNPSNGPFDLYVNDYSGKAELIISDMSGKTIQQVYLNIIKGHCRSEVTDMAEGLYLATLRWKGHSKTIKWLFHY
jgi:hypothetical protein